MVEGQHRLHRRAADWAEFAERGVERHAGFEQQGQLFGEGDAVGHLNGRWLQPAKAALRCWRRWGGRAAGGAEFDGHRV